MPTATLLPPTPTSPPAAATPAHPGRPVADQAGRRLDLPALAAAIAEDGIAAHEPAVADLVAAARAAGVPSASLDALADRRRPDVLRTRAFAHVARRVARA